MAKHGVVASENDLWLECACGYTPEYRWSLSEFLTLAEQDADIQSHIAFVTQRKQDIKDYLATRRAVTFLKEVDND